MPREIPPDRSTQHLPLVPSNPFDLNPSLRALSPGECEPIRARVVELVEIILETMAQDPEAGALTAMGPVVILMLKNYEITKLALLLTCLRGIAQAVLDLACSQDEYNDRMEPLIRDLSTALS